MKGPGEIPWRKGGGWDESKRDSVENFDNKSAGKDKP